MRKLFTSSTISITYATAEGTGHTISYDLLVNMPISRNEAPGIPEHSPLRLMPYLHDNPLENEISNIRTSTSSGTSVCYTFSNYNSYPQSQSMEELQNLASHYYAYVLPLCLHYLGILSPHAHRSYSFKELKIMLEIGILRETDIIGHDGSLDFEEEWHNLRTNAFRALCDVSMEYMKREDERLRRQLTRRSFIRAFAERLQWWNGRSGF